jgi:hypothetical protein
VEREAEKEEKKKWREIERKMVLCVYNCPEQPGMAGDGRLLLLQGGKTGTRRGWSSRLGWRMMGRHVTKHGAVERGGEEMARVCSVCLSLGGSASAG